MRPCAKNAHDVVGDVLGHRLLNLETPGMNIMDKPDDLSEAGNDFTGCYVMEAVPKNGEK